MPFDFTMYLIKADDCELGEGKPTTCRDVNNNDKPSNTISKRAATTTPSLTGSTDYINVFDSILGLRSDVPSLSHVDKITMDLKALKMDLKGSGSSNCKSDYDRSSGRSELMNCKSKPDTSSTNTHKLTGSNVNNSTTEQVPSKCKSRGLFAAIVVSEKPFRASKGEHNDSNCGVVHCDMCKGPRRALSLDSVRLCANKSKRRVTFADDNGMPLTKVRVMPRDPTDDSTSEIASLDVYGIHGRYKQLRLDFLQPAGDFNYFLERLQRQNVSLENVMTDGTSFLGTVRVKNLAMEKDVRMRFTTDGWTTWTDLVASYVYEDATLCYDLFGFHVSVGHVPSEVEFAVCYSVSGVQYWDNNNGKNYKLKMVTY